MTYGLIILQLRSYRGSHTSYQFRSATQKYLTSSENYEIQKVEYPNNLLRNVGLSVCSNGFVFVVDIDMLPSQGLHEQFQRMITMKPFQRLQKFAYVVPAFEASIQGIFVNKVR